MYLFYATMYYQIMLPFVVLIEMIFADSNIVYFVF
jgi:hypothetical protein